MQLGMIGLGRMGANMTLRLMRGGHQCVVYDPNVEAVHSPARKGATGASSLDEFVGKLKPPRTVWLMVSAAMVVKSLAELTGKLQQGDIVIDVGNSYCIDDIRRAKEQQSKGIYYLDVGTSGGVWGHDRGYCMMIGGDNAAVLSAALNQRFTSRGEDEFADKLLSAMRFEFGGHEEKHC